MLSHQGPLDLNALDPKVKKKLFDLCEQKSTELKPLGPLKR